MPRFFPAIVLVSVIACAACGDVTLKDPDAPDARTDVPDAREEVPDAREEEVPDAQPGTPDARPVITPDAREPDAAVPPDPPPPCVEGDAQLEDPDTGTCYMFFSTPRTWNAAAAACASVGAGTHFVALTSLDEHEDIIALTPDLLAVWLGATDSNSEGQFVWITGELVDFNVWATGEPNNGGTNGENCAILINSGTRAGFWDDRPCDVAFPYICERN
jgi:hypothetical protein